ncbi:hypothetical protein M3O57_06400 [Xanthomonas nasturtii]|uniref:Secreted protein n=2 Tax=Xanthomonas nasturtii TaxID=1843581 RepID=A0ABT0LS55_9XANT|nr:hypothetical protein [Xanthomonas nasturtii]MCL1530039.1 hypothetical protein [Xanthomonas nasturtii]MCL1552180.1 hypothetical protein [Xanthomonas nasturtii]MCL1556419.1 hypothetical protein [Xanthomonas nasturtii]MCL1564802.1 hypothetical protein [Xanthomonas nasturtii]MCL1568833.1 hypothetical protein [Xanthomonas nasturtii]
MRWCAVAMTLGALAACTAPPAPTPAATAAPVTCTDPKVEDEWLQHPAGLCGMPEDVRKLVDDYDTCEHFAGEEPYDADRHHEIEVAVAQLCTPAPARLAKLMQQYRNDAHISEWLRQYSAQADLQPAG